MQMRLNALWILSVLLTLHRETRGMECYQCNSKRDNDCAINKVDIQYLKPCASSQPFCRKAVYIYYFTDSREYIIIRECAKWRNAEKECYRGSYSRDSYQLICECKGVGCNRSTISVSECSIFLYTLCHFLVFMVRNFI